MGCASSIPDTKAGRLGGLNGENSASADSKNLRVKLVLLGVLVLVKAALFFVLFGVSLILLPRARRFKVWHEGSNHTQESTKAQEIARRLEEVTVGASFLSQTLALQDSTTVKFEIWDAAGQKRYAALAPLYYRGAAVAVVVYDITSPKSFSKAQYWVKELQKHGIPDIVMALVGNKADLHENRSVSTQNALEYGEKNGMFFIETSAKTTDNINQLFEEIAKRLPQKLPTS